MLSNIWGMVYFRFVLFTPRASHWSITERWNLLAGLRWDRFEDEDARGRQTLITVYAKRARGEMAAWLIQDRVRRASQLSGFRSGGYQFHDDASSPSVPVFRRRFADRP